MARIAYLDTVAGGKLTAEIINDAINIKAKCVRQMAAINQASGGGGSATNLETGGTFGTYFGVSAGNGAAFYTAFHDSVYLPLVALVDNALADLDNGG